MDELEKLLSKEQVVKIGDADVTVYSFDLEDLPDINKLSSNDTQEVSEAMKTLVVKCLKKSFPNATESQLNRFDIRFLNDYMNALFKVSGMEKDIKKLQPVTT